MSGESHTGTNLLPDLYVFVRIRFQISRFLFSEKYANFIHKQGALFVNKMRENGGSLDFNFISLLNSAVLIVGGFGQIQCFDHAMDV